MDGIREELGERATIVVIQNASHALVPEQQGAMVKAIIGWTRKPPR